MRSFFLVNAFLLFFSVYPHPYFDFKYDGENITCSHLTIEDGFSLLVTKETFRKPFLFHLELKKFLSQTTATASFHVYNKVQAYIVNSARENGFELFPDNFIAISTAIFANLQNFGVTNTISYPDTPYRIITMEKFLVSYLWSPFFTTVIVISGDACYSEQSCPFSLQQPNMIQLLHSIATDLEEFTHVSNVWIAYGFAFPMDMLNFFRFNCEIIADFFKTRFPSVSTVCRPYILSSDTPKLFYDKREELAKEMFHFTQADYYVLIDHSIKFITPSWLLTSIAPLMFGILYQHFGVISLAINLEKNHPAGMISSPLCPILTKLHFQLFENDSFFTATQPFVLNGLLLLSAYTVVNAAAPAPVYMQRVYDTTYDLSMMEDYYDQLLYNKRVLLRHLTEKGFYDLGKDSFDVMRLHEKLDGLIEIYCQDTPGCKEPYFQQQATSLKKMNEQTVYLWEEEGEGGIEMDAFSCKNQNLILSTEEYSFSDLFPLSLNVMIQGALVKSTEAPENLLHYDEDSRINYFFYPKNTSFYRKYPANAFYQPQAKVAVITAIFGGYENSCKEYAQQTIPTNFICFTDNSNVPNKGWIVDTIPYHLFRLREEFDQQQLLSEYINTFHHNFHPFNLAKYYKLSFQQIPILSQYDIIVWVDGTVRITNPKTIETVLQVIGSEQTDDDEFFLDQRLFVVFEHIRDRNMTTEAVASATQDKYNLPIFNSYYQPVQPIVQQYLRYESKDLTPDYWNQLFQYTFQQLIDRNLYRPWQYREQYGMWCTCFIAFNMRKAFVDVQTARKKTSQMFLERWYHETLLYSTQDQISFPFVVKELEIFPASFPDHHYQVYGSYDFNSLFVKLDHGL